MSFGTHCNVQEIPRINKRETFDIKSTYFSNTRLLHWPKYCNSFFSHLEMNIYLYGGNNKGGGGWGYVDNCGECIKILLKM